MMPFLGLWRLAGYDPAIVLFCALGGWAAYGFVITTIKVHMDFRKDDSEPRA
jgi:hypothetical protein